jgi:K+-transporting ATPase ATPase C chain
MKSHLRSNLWLLGLTVIICSVLYPVVLWAVGQTVFPHQANGSLLDENGRPVTDADRARGSRLIGQPFKGDEFFQPRPSNAGSGYDASASGASNWGASNPLLRSRVARALGPIVRYRDTSPKNPGELVGEEIDEWFQKQCRADKKFVAKWAADYSTLAERYVNENPEAVADWLKANSADPALADYRGKIEEVVARVKGDNAAAARLFFPQFAEKHLGDWPAVKNQKVQPKHADSDDIKAYFFDLWLQDNPTPMLEQVPSDMVMASGSGLDPHITLDNARYQLRHRVAGKQALKILAKDPEVRRLTQDLNTAKTRAGRRRMEARLARRLAPMRKRVEKAVEEILQACKEAPFGGLAGEELVNVLELNLALTARMKQLAREQ